MKKEEGVHIFVAWLVFIALTGFGAALAGKWDAIPEIMIFTAIILLAAVGCRKIMARLLDADVEHEIWKVDRYGFKPHEHFKDPVPTGIIAPLAISFFSLGLLKAPTLLTYESRPLLRRAARRFGYYSHSEMTEWHNGLIGAAGILGVLILTIVFYTYSLEPYALLATAYAFVNMIPLSKLDGTQILFGSRVLWAILACITLLFTFYALLILANTM